jgi:hypothetical protein
VTKHPSFEAVEAEWTGWVSLTVTLRLLYRLPADLLGGLRDGGLRPPLLH